MSTRIIKFLAVYLSLVTGGLILMVGISIVLFELPIILWLLWVVASYFIAKPHLRRAKNSSEE